MLETCKAPYFAMVIFCNKTVSSSLTCLCVQMLEGGVKKIALDFDVEKIAKTAKASKDSKIAEVGADIELIVKQC